MRLRLIAPALAVLVSGAIATTALPAAAAPAPAPAATAAAAAPVSVPLTGTATDGRPFAGNFVPTNVSRSGGQLSVTGLVTGTLTSATGVVTPVSQRVTTAAAIAQASCTILDLTLGPLHLNLLGLVVDLNQVHLQITGQTGNGQLLGNLLCGLANALNGGGGGLANILNRLLGL